MREYGKISGKFWTQGTGKAIRGNAEAQLVALYLMTCPTSEMTGVFQCPKLYIAHETGLGMEGACKGLQSLIDLEYCMYDDDTETVFVYEMAKFQIGEELKVSDNQVKAVIKAYSSMTGAFKTAFFERYSEAFHLPNASPSEAPSKPRAGTSTRTEAGAETITPPAAKPSASKKSKTALPNGFALSDRVIAWADEKGHGNLQAHLENFISAAKRNAYAYADWDEALMEAIRKDWAKLAPARASPAGYESAKDKSRRETNEALTGRSHEQRTPDFIDIN